MKYKQARTFNIESYKKYDKPAKDMFSEYLKSKGYEVFNEETKGIDLIAKKDNNTLFIEVETTKNYFTSKKDYPFKNTIKFLGRKEKYRKVNEFYYVIINLETKCALYSKSNRIFKTEYAKEVYVNNKERRGLDRFFYVPIEECKFIKM